MLNWTPFDANAFGEASGVGAVLLEPLTIGQANRVGDDVKTLSSLIAIDHWRVWRACGCAGRLRIIDIWLR